MRIKKGNEFVCIKKVVMKGSKVTEYKKGFIYISELDDCITNESGNVNHFWNTEKIIKKYFIKLK